MKTVTIDRTFGSGGREVAARLANLTGVPFFDNDIILRAAENFGVDVGLLKNNGTPPLRAVIIAQPNSTSCSVRI